MRMAVTSRLSDLGVAYNDQELLAGGAPGGAGSRLWTAVPQLAWWPCSPAPGSRSTCCSARAPHAADLVAAGDGGFFMDRVVTPVFYGGEGGRGAGPAKARGRPAPWSARLTRACPPPLRTQSWPMRWTTWPARAWTWRAAWGTTTSMSRCAAARWWLPRWRGWACSPPKSRPAGPTGGARVAGRAAWEAGVWAGCVQGPHAPPVPRSLAARAYASLTNLGFVGRDPGCGRAFDPALAAEWWRNQVGATRGRGGEGQARLRQGQRPS
jgi:hypothetical protein